MELSVWILFKNLLVFEGVNDVEDRAFVQFQLLGNFTDTERLL